jgi:hypothetical protein
MKNNKTYHVGLVVNKNKAILQFRRTIDELSCEILEYYGEYVTTKKEAKERLQFSRIRCLKQLNEEFPNRNFVEVRID